MLRQLVVSARPGTCGAVMMHLGAPRTAYGPSPRAPAFGLRRLWRRRLTDPIGASRGDTPRPTSGSASGCERSQPNRVAGRHGRSRSTRNTRSRIEQPAIHPFQPPRLKAGAHHRPLQPRLDRQFHWRLGFSQSRGPGPLAFENTNPYRLGVRGAPGDGAPLTTKRHQ